MCLRSQLDTASYHLPIIYDIWQVHKHPCVPVLYVGHFRVHPRMQRKQGWRWLRAPLEGISDNGFGKEIMDTFPLLQRVSRNSDCNYGVFRALTALKGFCFTSHWDLFEIVPIFPIRLGLFVEGSSWKACFVESLICRAAYWCTFLDTTWVRVKKPPALVWIILRLIQVKNPYHVLHLADVAVLYLRMFVSWLNHLDSIWTS